MGLLQGFRFGVPAQDVLWTHFPNDCHLFKCTYRKVLVSISSNQGFLQNVSIYVEYLYRLMRKFHINARVHRLFIVLNEQYLANK